jgi:hypothetical protein
LLVEVIKLETLCQPSRFVSGRIVALHLRVPQFEQRGGNVVQLFEKTPE